MMQSFAPLAWTTVLRFAFGYSMCFGPSIHGIICDPTYYAFLRASRATRGWNSARHGVHHRRGNASGSGRWRRVNPPADGRIVATGAGFARTQAVSPRGPGFRRSARVTPHPAVQTVRPVRCSAHGRRWPASRSTGSECLARSPRCGCDRRMPRRPAFPETSRRHAGTA